MQSRKLSANPIMYIATAMEFARVNIRPMAPPNSGPSAREILRGCSQAAARRDRTYMK